MRTSAEFQKRMKRQSSAFCIVLRIYIWVCECSKSFKKSWTARFICVTVLYYYHFYSAFNKLICGACYFWLKGSGVNLFEPNLPNTAVQSWQVFRMLSAREHNLKGRYPLKYCVDTYGHQDYLSHSMLARYVTFGSSARWRKTTVGDNLKPLWRWSRQ